MSLHTVRLYPFLVCCLAVSVHLLRPRLAILHFLCSPSCRLRHIFPREYVPNFSPIISSLEMHKCTCWWRPQHIFWFRRVQRMYVSLGPVWRMLKAAVQLSWSSLGPHLNCFNRGWCLSIMGLEAVVRNSDRWSQCPKWGRGEAVV